MTGILSFQKRKEFYSLKQKLTQNLDPAIDEIVADTISQCQGQITLLLVLVQMKK